MRNDICTIPINEVFEVVDGCPICRMIHTVEDHVLDYIMGAAMMEPDVRIETNRQGFCPDHLGKMMARRGRLPLALMLESHMGETKDIIKNPKKAKELEENCFICNKIDWGVSRMVETICRSYENEREFRALFDAQEHFCLLHYNMLMDVADKKHMRRYHGEFAAVLKEKTSAYAEKLQKDLKKYCSMYDYRANGETDWGDARFAVERTAEFFGKEI